MERRELFKKSILAAGASLATLSSGMALAQAQDDKKGYAAQPDMLKGQEIAEFNPKEAHAYAVGIQAFEYGFPLVYFASLMWEWAKNPNSALKPLNAWITAKDFVATSNYRYGGSFNTDTVYTAAFTDLRKGPMVLSTKDPEGHYFATQLSDLYTNNFAYISKRSGGKLWGNFLLVPPGWKGDIPTGKFDRVIQCEQKWVFTLLRLRIDQEDPKEVAWAKAKFSATKLTPLDDYLAGREFVANDFNIYDVTQFARSPLRPFHIINHMLKENPPPAMDDNLMQAFKTVNIGAGLDLSKNDPDVNRGLARAAKDALPVLRSQVERPWARAVNGWFYFPTDIGLPQTSNYVMRSAMQALWGIVAHPPRECTYLWASQDQNGERLNSKGVYELYMRKDQFPKVEAFWSFTMYQDFNLVVNDINRWAIRDNSKHLKYEADGSLRIFIQSERPAEDKVSNWLPSPKTGNFNLTMRNYMPSVEIIEQRYDPPVLKRLA